MGTTYAEVTYHKDNKEMYVDLYSKLFKKTIKEEDLNTKVSI